MGRLLAMLWESKTFLAFVIVVALGLTLFGAALLAQAAWGKSIPYLSDMLDWLLRAFGILVGRNVIADGLPRVVDAWRGNGQEARGIEGLKQVAQQREGTS